MYKNIVKDLYKEFLILFTKRYEDHDIKSILISINKITH